MLLPRTINIAICCAHEVQSGKLRDRAPSGMFERNELATRAECYMSVKVFTRQLLKLRLSRRECQAIIIIVNIYIKININIVHIINIINIINSIICREQNQHTQKTPQSSMRFSLRFSEMPLPPHKSTKKIHATNILRSGSQCVVCEGFQSWRPAGQKCSSKLTRRAAISFLEIICRLAAAR